MFILLRSDSKKSILTACINFNNFQLNYAAKIIHSKIKLTSLPKKESATKPFEMENNLRKHFVNLFQRPKATSIKNC